ERAYETVVAGVRMRAPMMAIHTVAAGGGSICTFDGARFRVGPESAGAAPGPACYRRGGPLTVTDCNLMLGKLQPEHFPAVFGPNGDAPLDRGVVERLFADLADRVAEATGRRLAPAEIAEGFLTIAVENMATAIKHISIQRGYDVTGYTLACFGGAGGQHACLVADALGMSRVMIHPLAGVLSAYGMGLADVRAVRETTVEAPLDAAGSLDARIQALGDQARDALLAQDAPVQSVEILLRANLKYAGTDTPLPVPYGPPAAMAAAFSDAHRQRFGFVAEAKPLIVDSLSAEAVGRGREVPPAPAQSQPSTAIPAPLATAPARMAGAQHATPLYARDDLPVGGSIDGPAVITEATSTTVVEPGWRATVDAGRNLILERVTALPARTAIGTEADPVMLEVFNNLFMAVAEQMGFALQNTAYSVNIKERLDFSCALFDGAGGLIANAPHIPVHLGSMGDSIRAVIRSRGGGADGRGMRPGDAYMLNAPYNGGTHLPDITVIVPVFVDEDADPAFYVAARGHHADVGGLTPGSMPPASRTVEDEGVLIDDFLLVDAGRFREAETRALLASGPHPARNPDQNIGDLKAQIAACRRGADELRRVMVQFGRPVVEAYMRHVQDNAEESVRRVLGALSDGRFDYELDGGAVVRVQVTVDQKARRATVDFTGSSPQLPTNFNAPLSITRAAVLY
ncbi:MAG: hydantoinase B/oxoprolinase family protein, partial [Proteobacteria bacterium]|nr:hydantoinase B/oxoprolinase family protein [Pseudomonadota bacterium]